MKREMQILVIHHPYTHTHTQTNNYTLEGYIISTNAQNCFHLITRGVGNPRQPSLTVSLGKLSQYEGEFAVLSHKSAGLLVSDVE